MVKCEAPEHLAALLQGWQGDLTLVLSTGPGFHFLSWWFMHDREPVRLATVQAWREWPQADHAQAALPAAVQHAVVFGVPVSPTWLDVVPASVRLVAVHTCEQRANASAAVLPGCPESLATLTLCLAGVPRLPEMLGPLAHLRTLDLSGCAELTCLPATLGQLTGLTTLELRRCASLTRLPESIGQLPVLTTLDLRFCHGLVCLPGSMGQWTTLARLDLDGCAGLTRLPESIGQLTSLTMLILRDCRGLAWLPESVGQLTALTTLSCGFCKALTCLPESIGRLTGLTVLILRSCEALTALPESVGRLVALEVLDLWGCEPLTCLPESLGQLTHLTLLDTAFCHALPKAHHWWARGVQAANKTLPWLQQRLLVLVMIGRRRDAHRLPPEIWGLVHVALWQSQPERSRMNE
mgnify:CR=1 FL=1